MPSKIPASSSPTASAAPTATIPANAGAQPGHVAANLADRRLRRGGCAFGVIDALQIDLSFRLIVAAALRLAVGFEREIHGHPAGLRTHMLVASGSALFTVLSACSRPNVPGAGPISRPASRRRSCPASASSASAPS